MKKRIMATTMASFMALNAANSLMAYADLVDFKTESITKADLTKLLNDPEIVKLNEGEVNNYGSKSSANFIKAIAYAESVQANDESTDVEATAAFLMVKAAKNALVFHDKVELNDLVEQYRSQYEKGNILNDREEAKYNEGDWGDFEQAWITASYLVDSDDLLATTDAYEELWEEKDPKLKATKTKAEIESAKRKFEAALALEYKHQPWIRGTVKNSNTDYDGQGFAWGVLFAHVKSGMRTVFDQYTLFDTYQTVGITSNEAIVKAVNAMNMAADVLNGFTEVSTSGGSGTINRLLGTYQGRLVYTYSADGAEAILKSLITKVGSDAGSKIQVKVNNSFVNLEDQVAVSAIDGSGSYKSFYWNTEISAKTTEKIIQSRTPAKEAQKLIVAELVVKNTSGSDLFYLVDTNMKAVNGTAMFSTGTAGAGVYFFESEAAAKTAGGGTGTLQIMPFAKNNTLTISDRVTVSSAEIREGFIESQTMNATAVQAEVAKWEVFGQIADNYLKDLATYYSGLKDAHKLVSYVATASVNLASNLVDTAASLKLESAYTDFVNMYDFVAGFVAKAKNGLVVVADGTATAGLVSGTGLTLASATASLRDLIGLISIDTTGTMGASNLPLEKAFGAMSDATAMTSLMDLFANGMQSINATYSNLISTTLKADLGSYGAVAGTFSAAYDTAHTNAVTSVGDGDALGLSNFVIDGENGVAKRASQTNAYYDTTLDNVAWDTGKYSNNLTKLVSAFNFSSVYTPTSETAPCDETTPSLVKAVRLLEAFNIADESEEEWKDILTLDNANKITLGSATKPTGAAWTQLYTYIKYALEDEFDASLEKTYRLSDIEKLINQSYELTEQTIHTSMFSDSHSNLVSVREKALRWRDTARSPALLPNRRYEEYKTQIEGETSTSMYNLLKAAYDRLNKELSGFKCSFEEVRDYLSTVAVKIDSGEFDATTNAKLTALLETAALDFVKLADTLVYEKAGDVTDSAAFDYDGSLNVYNRLLTKDTKLYPANDDIKLDSNKTHKTLVASLKALQTAYNAAVEGAATPATPSLDINGDGKVGDLNDVTELLKIYVGISDIKSDVAKHDLNGDGKVNLDDVTWLLKKYVGI